MGSGFPIRLILVPDQHQFDGLLLVRTLLRRTLLGRTLLGRTLPGRTLLGRTLLGGLFWGGFRGGFGKPIIEIEEAFGLCRRSEALLMYW